MINKKRHMDYIYQTENYYDNPKESFKYLFQNVKRYMVDTNTYSLLDIGCSKGEFINYLNKNHKRYFKKLVGVDNSSTLIKEAKKNLKDHNVFFYYGNAEQFKLNTKFDFIVISGVMGYFDNLTKVLNNIKKHLKQNGKAFIFNFFNQYDIDVILKYRNNKYFSTFETGWNMHSITTLNKISKQLGLKIYQKDIFHMPFKLNKKVDPGRSWTTKTDDGIKFVNGINLIYDIFLIVIGKNK